MNDLEIGRRIKELREQMNLTQENFCELANISVAYLSQLETGKRHASLVLTARIAKLLNVSLDFLIYGNSSIDIDRQELIDMINNASNRQLKIIKEVLLNLKK